MEELLREAVRLVASDLHIVVGVPPVFRVDGRLTQKDSMVLTDSDTKRFFLEITNEKQQRYFEDEGEIDFPFVLEGVSRFRVNVFRQRGSVAIAVRVISESVPSIQELKLPLTLQKLAENPRGLVLVTGPTGSGKSTTLAAMIRYINEKRACYILTLEDPIEYLHSHNKSIISQREVHTDTKTFGNALRAALREDPDVILVGEMRDHETMATAITAAETGHLVFATLHTSSAAQTVDRIVDSFPAYQQNQIKAQLSVTLQGIISQQLLPKAKKKGRVAALEILVANPAIRNLIRDGKTNQLNSSIQGGFYLGMQTMDTALRDLVRGDVVAYEDALDRAFNAEQFVNLVSCKDKE